MNRIFSIAVVAAGFTWMSGHAQRTETIPTQTNRLPSVDTQVADVASAVTVTVNLNYDSSLAPTRVEALSPGKQNRQQVYYGSKKATFTLAPGEYDFHLVLTIYNPKLPVTQQYNFYEPYHHVFKEKVKVESDMEITLDAEEATNYVRFTPVTPTGEEYRHIVLRNNSFDYSDANIYFETTALEIYNKDNGEVECFYGTSNHDCDDGRSTLDAFNFFVNDVSDRYVFTQTRLAVSDENRLYALMMSKTGVESGVTTVANAAGDFRHLEESFTFSPSYNYFPHELYYSGMDVYARINNLDCRSLNYLSAYSYPDVYVGFVGADKDINYDFYTCPKIFELDKVTGNDESQRAQYITYGCPLHVTPDGEAYESNVNKYFSYDKKMVDGSMGDNVPVTSMVMHQVSTDAGNTQLLYAPTFVGRYGERREADISDFEVVVCHNGEPVCSSLTDLNTWAATWADNGHEPGKMTATFTNRNCEFWGEKGTNVLQLEYTEGQNDMCAPAVQMLTFSNPSGLVTNLFNPGEQVIATLAAGDPKGYGSRYSYMEASSVSLEVAPHGSSTFSKINPGMVQGATSSTNWAVYEGTFTNLPASGSGLYDVRLSLVDNENNTSVQTISPAFYVRSQAAIDVIEPADGATISFDGSELRLSGFPAGTVATVHNVAGECVVKTADSTISLESLTPGVYVVSAGAKSHKIIKR